MVNGLEVFRNHFTGLSDRYILIGGTACHLAMNEAGLDFRVTRDLDIVLCIEALDREFVEAFWAFIHKGQYRLQEKSTGKRQYYRFLLGGRRESSGLSFAGPEHLIPLKAKAWLDLSARKNQREIIDAKTIRKHRNDVFRLYRVLGPAFTAEIPDSLNPKNHSKIRNTPLLS